MNTLSLRKIFILAVATLTVSVADSLISISGPAFAETVYVIPVSGTVDPGLAAFLERSLSEDRTPDPDAIYVFDFDTFGGRVDAALNIVDSLLTKPPDRTVAYVSNKAISAGALIALACGRLYMKNSTTIGDCAPIIYSEEGPKMMGEKFQSPLRAKFRALARRNGYPSTLAESMVSADMEVYEIVIDNEKHYIEKHEFEELEEEKKKAITRKRTVVAEGELLTMHDEEAAELGFSQASVSGLDELLQNMGLQNAAIVLIQETWSESMVRFIGSIAPILMLLGLGALYMEIQSPGFGVPGIVGILLLAIVFLNQYMAGLADHTELLIILLGLAVLGFELFVIPGFGIAGMAGIALIIAGLILTLQYFVLPDPSLPWESAILIRNIAKVLGSCIGAFIGGLLMFSYVLPRFTASRNGPYLSATLGRSRADSFQTSLVKAGDTGIALTFLRPSGKVEINDEVFDVVTDGEYVEKGAKVIVTKIRGNIVIVSGANG